MKRHSKRICVFTGTRAEYGLLYWLMKEIENENGFSLQLLVSGSHLSPEFGYTKSEIVQDGFAIDEELEMLLSSNTRSGVVKSMGLALIGLPDIYSRLSPDLVVILGDRFEALAAAQAALIMGIPIAHIHGGEVTEGAYDDEIRHSISKMASIHFCAAEIYRKRLIQLGEAPSAVYNFGAIGLDHLIRTERLSAEELTKIFEFDFSSPFFLVTYHTATNASENPRATITNLLNAAIEFEGYNLLITYPNADHGGREIIAVLEEFECRFPERIRVVQSLGYKNYASVLSLCSLVLGNSSSGIIEAPSFGVPTVNVGERQAGRLASSSVVNSKTGATDVSAAITKALSLNHQKNCDPKNNPYGAGDVSKRIAKVLLNESIKPKRSFFDIEFQYE